MSKDTESKIVSNLPSMIKKKYYTKQELESLEQSLVSEEQNVSGNNIRDQLSESRQRRLDRLNISVRTGIALE